MHKAPGSSTGTCVAKSASRHLHQQSQGETHRSQQGESSAGARGRVADVYNGRHACLPALPDCRPHDCAIDGAPTVQHAQVRSRTAPRDSEQSVGQAARRKLLGQPEARVHFGSWLELVTAMRDGKIRLTWRNVAQTCLLLVTAAVIRLSQSLAVLVMF